MFMKKGLVILLTVILFFLNACSNATNNEETIDVNSTEENNETEETNKKVLVVYFSATGTTKKVAEMIADITNGDTYEIIPSQEYTSADLNWNDSNIRTTIEQNDTSTRPEIGSQKISLDEYSVIYLGYPIWWGEEPRIMDTFVESYDFGEKKIIPFCTSGSSGVGKSDKNLENNANGGNWQKGTRFGSNVSKEDLQTWVENK